MTHPRIAVLGAGHVGSAIARVALAAGYRVTIASSGDPEQIALAARARVPGAETRWTADAVREADLVVLAIPLHRFATFDPTLVAGALVVDTMNYWPSVDGVQEAFEERRAGSSEIVQCRLAGSTIVKTFNHIGYRELENARRPAGSPERRALGVAGDDAFAVAVVSRVVERVGYDAVSLSSLSAGRILEPGGPVFGVPLRRAEFERVVHAPAA